MEINDLCKNVLYQWLHGHIQPSMYSLYYRVYSALVNPLQANLSHNAL